MTSVRAANASAASMHAASAAQRRAFARGELPPIESVLPEGEIGILAVPQAMPGLRLPYSLSYLVHSQGEAHLIDTGMGNEQNWELLSDALASAGLRVTDIASVTLTHVHRDHAGLAARVRSVSGATVRMHEADARAVRAQTPRIDPDEFDATLDRWGVPGATQDELRTQVRDLSRPEESIPIDEEVRDGAELQLGEVRVRALHTPGHTAGHLSVVADDLDLVFTGDHILPAMSSGVGLGGLSDRFDPLSDYLASVRRIQVLGALQVCPGHGYRFFGADARCAEILAHHDGAGRRSRNSSRGTRRPRPGSWHRRCGGIADGMTWMRAPVSRHSRKPRCTPGWSAEARSIARASWWFVEGDSAQPRHLGARWSDP